MTTAAIEPTLLLSMWLRAPFPFPLKLLGVAEEEEALDDALLPLELDVCALALEPVTLAAETDLKQSHEVQCEAIENTDEEAGDDVDAELVVEDTGGPMGKAPLVPSTLLTLLYSDRMSMTHVQQFRLPTRFERPPEYT
jgi:hypothetical protein